MNLGNLKHMNIYGTKRIDDLRFLLKMDMVGIHNLSGFSPKEFMQSGLIESLERKHPQVMIDADYFDEEIE